MGGRKGFSGRLLGGATALAVCLAACGSSAGGGPGGGGGQAGGADPTGAIASDPPATPAGSRGAVTWQGSITYTDHFSSAWHTSTTDGSCSGDASIEVKTGDMEFPEDSRLADERVRVTATGSAKSSCSETVIWFDEQGKQHSCQRSTNQSWSGDVLDDAAAATLQITPPGDTADGGTGQYTLLLTSNSGGGASFDSSETPCPGLTHVGGYPGGTYGTLTADLPCTGFSACAGAPASDFGGDWPGWPTGSDAKPTHLVGDATLTPDPGSGGDATVDDKVTVHWDLVWVGGADLLPTPGNEPTPGDADFQCFIDTVGPPGTPIGFVIQTSLPDPVPMLRLDFASDSPGDTTKMLGPGDWDSHMAHFSGPLVFSPTPGSHDVAITLTFPDGHQEFCSPQPYDMPEMPPGS